MPAAANDDTTVVIANYDYGAFLREAIASAHGQDGGPARVIVVDDGSRDPATLAVLDALEAEIAAGNTGGPLELHRLANRGAAAARNFGLERADTPFMLILDADDRLAADAVPRLRAALAADSRAGYAYGHMEFFGEWQGVMRMPPFDPWRILFRHTVGPTALMRAEMVRDTGGQDPAFRHWEDWEIWVHALAHGWHGVQVDFTAMYQRKHGVTKYASDRARYHEGFAALRRKHASLYGDLAKVRRESALGRAERSLYRWVWGPRPWPPGLEKALYSLLWRPGRGGTSTTTIAR